MKTDKILIIGGKGKTGSRVVDRLTGLGYTNIRLGSRSEAIPFDWEDPETWPAVLSGMDAVYITFQPDLAIPSATDIIRKFATLADRCGVEKMVLLSGRGEKAAQECEEIVRNTAKKWTIVRASWFNQNFSESIFLEPIISGVVALPRGEALEPFTDADDIADVVVEALINDRHHAQVYELTGPRLMTFPQAVKEIAEATGRDIKFQPLTLDENREILKNAQLPEGYIWLVNYLFEDVLDGRNASVSDDIERALGRKAKDFKEFVKDTAATGVWNRV